MSGASFLDAELEFERRAPGCERGRARLGRDAGAQRLGASLYELPPGNAVCPYHWHAAEEEILVALTEGVSLRTPGGWRELAPGEVVAFPPGPEGAHQVANFGDRPARALLLSQVSAIEVCCYPDSGKVMADALDFGVSLVFRERDAVDYSEGEEPPAPPGG